jgi:hypothetical protein
MASTSTGGGVLKSMVPFSIDYRHAKGLSIHRSGLTLNGILKTSSAIAAEEKAAIRSRLLTALDEEQKPVKTRLECSLRIGSANMNNEGYLTMRLLFALITVGYPKCGIDIQDCQD